MYEVAEDEAVGWELPEVVVEVSVPELVVDLVPVVEALASVEGRLEELVGHLLEREPDERLLEEVAGLARVLEGIADRDGLAGFREIGGLLEEQEAERREASDVVVSQLEAVNGRLERFETVADGVYLALMVVPAVYVLSLLYRFFRELIT